MRLPLASGGHRLGPCAVEGTGALLWALWRADLWAPEWAALAGLGEAIDCGVLFMDLAWRRSAWGARRAWLAVEAATGVPCIGGAPPDASSVPRYRKVASLVAHVLLQAAPGSVPALLEAIETFAALSAGRWLKVAGAEKAEVIRSALAGGAPGRGDRWRVRLEFGAFVGYTAARLSTRGAPVVTVEQDPIHNAVARWHLDYARVAWRAEVFPGRVVDSTPGIGEGVGAASVGFLFLDEGGSSFAADHAQLERLGGLAAAARLVADNCLRPGAPIFAARSLGRGSPFASAAWALPEFLEERLGIEDWMVVITALRGAS